MKFRKLIAAVCAGCLLVSNISFADLPEESVQENPAQEAVQQTEELNPLDESQPGDTLIVPEQADPENGKADETDPETVGGSEEKPTESNDQPDGTCVGNQPDIPESQQEALQQEQESQPEVQPDIPDAQPKDQTQEQPVEPKPQTVQQPEQAATQTEQQPENQTDKQPEELTAVQDPQEKTGDEENIQTLEIGGVLSGTLRSDEVYKTRLIPEWDLELVFTLKVPAWGEGAAHINLKDEEIELIRKETEDPEAQDILYTFEETVTGGETYDFILTADWEIPFTLKVERKEEATGDDATQADRTGEDVHGETSQKAETDEFDPEAAEKKAGKEEDVTDKKMQGTDAKGDTLQETTKGSETGEDHREQTDEQPEPTETVYLPTGSLEFKSPEFAVTASFADGVIPEGTTLEAEEILPGTELYEQITGITRDMITDDWNEMGDEYRVLDIRFMLNGEEIEPQGTVDIQVRFHHAIAMEEEDSLQVIHLDENNNAELVNADTLEKVRNDEIRVDQVSFSSDSLSPFVFAVKKPVTVTIWDQGRTYRVTIEYKESNEISPEAEVVVTEIAEGSDAYEAYRAQAAETMNAEGQMVCFSGLYDIRIIDNGKAVQPSGDVKVTMELLDSETDGELQVLHFAGGDTAAPEPVSAEIDGNTVTFSTDGFSVYGFAYTVDYTYENREYHMQGATDMLLSELFTALGIEADTCDVLSVDFTDETLLTFTQEDNDWRLTSLKPFNSEETLTVTMKDGTVYVIAVTDDAEFNLKDTANATTTIKVSQSSTTTNISRDANIAFNMDFTIPDTAVESAKGNTPWVYDFSDLAGTDVSKQFSSFKNVNHGTMFSSDGITTLGWYKIENNKVYIYPDATWLDSVNNGIGGSFYFSAQLNENANKDKKSDTITFNGSANIPVKYEEIKLQSSKKVGALENQATAVNDGRNLQVVQNANGTYTLYYEVSVTPETNITELTFSESFSNNQSLVEGSIKLYKNGEEQTSFSVTNVQNGFSGNLGKVTKNTNYVLKYQTTITAAQLADNSNKTNSITWDYGTGIKKDNTDVKTVFETKLESSKRVGVAADAINHTGNIYYGDTVVLSSTNADGTVTLYYETSVTPNKSDLKSLTLTDVFGEGGGSEHNGQALVGSTGTLFINGVAQNEAIPLSSTENGFTADIAKYLSEHSNRVVADTIYTIRYQVNVAANQVGYMQTNKSTYTSGNASTSAETGITPKVETGINAEKFVASNPYYISTTSGNLELNKNSDGSYTLYYRLHAKPSANMSFLNVSDVIRNGQTYVEGSLRYGSVDGTQVTATVTTSGTDTTITFDAASAVEGGLKKDTDYNFYYQVTVTDEQLGQALGNESTWSNANGGTEHSNTGVTTSKETKVTKTATDSEQNDANGKTYHPGDIITFTVTYGVATDGSYINMAGHHIYDQMTNLGVLDGDIQVTVPYGSETIELHSAGELNGANENKVTVFDYTFPATGNYTGPYVITYSIRLSGHDDWFFSKDLSNTAFDNDHNDAKTIKVDYEGANIAKEASSWDPESNTILWSVVVTVDEGKSLSNVDIVESDFQYGPNDWTWDGNLTIDWQNIRLECLNTEDTDVPAYSKNRNTNTIHFNTLNKSVRILIPTISDKSFTSYENFNARNKATLKFGDYQKPAEAKDVYKNTTITLTKDGTLTGQTAKWSAIINQSMVELDPASDYVPWFKDQIPANMELVDHKIHVKITGSGNTYWYEYDNDVTLNEGQLTENTINLSLGALSGNESAPYTLSKRRYEITYETRIKDSALANIQIDANAGVFTNNAELDRPGGTKVTGASDTVVYEYQNVIQKTDLTENKRALGEGGIGDSELAYQVDINKNAIKLNKGEYLTLSDIIPTNMTIQPDTIRLIYGNGDKQGQTISDAIIGYNDDTRELTVYVPDETYAILSFNAIGANVGNDQTFTNTVTLKGVIEDSSTVTEKHDISEAGGSLHGEKGQIILHKRDQYNLSKSLAGAEFELYEVQFDQTTYKITGATKIGGTFVTGSNGIAIFKPIQTTDQTNKHLYYWIETKAPENYVITSNVPHYFVTYDADDVNKRQAAWDLDDACQAANGIRIASVVDGYTWQFANVEDSEAKAELKVTKTMRGRAMEDNEFSFLLKDENGQVLQTIRNSATAAGVAEEILFAPIVYKASGTYTYTISEQASVSEDDSVYYDRTVYTVTVTVERDENTKALKAPTITYRKPKNSDTYSSADFVNSVPGKTDIAITKRWNDESNADNIRLTPEEYAAKIHLYCNGTEVTATYAANRTITDNGDNTYTVSYGNLPDLVDGADAVYTVKEDAVDGYTQDTASSSLAGGVPTGGTIINTHESKGSLKLTKTVTVGGTAPNNSTMADGTYTFTITKAGDTNSTPVTVTFTIDQGAIQSTTGGNEYSDGYVEVKDLTPGDYIITETEPTNGTVLSSASGGKNVSDEKAVTVTVHAGKQGDAVPADSIATFNNDRELTDIVVEKKWIRANGSDTWPDGVTVEVVLVSDGKETDQKMTLSADTPTTSFTGLPVKDDKGHSISYSVNELTISNYTSAAGELTDGKIAITNIEHKGTLKVKKSVTGEKAKTQGFKFTVQDSEGNYYDSNGNNKGTTQTEMTIADGGTVEVLNLPLGTYTVTELYTDQYDANGGAKVLGYTLVSAAAQTGKLSSNGQIVEVSLVNNYTAKEGTAQIHGTKVYDKAYDGNEFTFEMIEVDANGNPVSGSSTVTANAEAANAAGTDGKYSSTFTFPTITYKKIGTYYYKVTERKGSKNYINYAENTYIVSVKVEDKEKSTLDTTVTYPSEGMIFVNEYTAKGSVALEAKKTLQGRKLETDAFEFVLLDASEQIIQTGKRNDADGRVLFGEIEYTEADIASLPISYKIKEVIPSDAVNKVKNGITYDGREIPVTVTLTDDGTGHITATPNYGEKPENYNTNNEFINTYESSGILSLTAKKTLDGGVPTGKTFTFTLTRTDSGGTALNDINNAYTTTAQNTDGGEITFKSIPLDRSFFANGEMEKNIYYTIKETVNNSDQTIIYDTHTELITVNLKDDGKGHITATPDVNGASILFNNTTVQPATATLQVSKSLINKTLTDNAFNFILTAKTDGDPNVQNGNTKLQTKPNTGSIVQFDALNYNTNVLGAESSKIFTYDITEEIPSDAKDANGKTYEETQGNSASYTKNGITYDKKAVTATVTVTKTEDKLSTSIAYGEAGSTFINTYNAKGSVSLEATKTLEGKTLEASKYTFTLSNDENNTLQTKKNGESGTDAGKISFDAIDYTLSDLQGASSKDFHYTIRETKADEGGIVYDEHTEEVTVTVTDKGDGTLEAVAKYDTDGASFTNRYVTKPVDVSVRGKKTLTGATLASNQFSFTLTRISAKESTAADAKDILDSNENQTKYNKDADGNIEFDALHYTQAGVYTYQIREASSSGNGITVDGRVYTLTVTVTDNGHGELEAVKKLTYINENEETTEVNDSIAEFINTYSAEGSAIIEARKELEGKELKKDQFTFELIKKSAKNTAGGDITDSNDDQTGIKNTADGKINFAELNYSIPGIYVYEVRETGNNANGITLDQTTYQVTVRVYDENNGTLGSEVTYKNLTTNQNTTAPIVFKNKYTTEDVETTLEAQKRLVDKDNNAIALKDRVFDFSMTLTSAKDGTTDRTAVAPASRTAQNSADGKIAFEKLTFTKPGVYVYTVTETTASGNGITKDSSVYTVTYTVTDNGKGKLELSCATQKGNENADSIVFTNQYRADSTSADVLAKKELSGRALKAGEFVFSLTKVSAVGADNTTAITDSNKDQLLVLNELDGSINFDSLNYTAAGTYIYLMKEVTVSTDEVIADTTEYTVKVVVTDDGNGHLNAVRTYWKGSQEVSSENVKFNNQYQSGQLKISKEVTGNTVGDNEKAKEFTFTVTLKNAAGEGVTETYAAEKALADNTTQTISVSFAEGKAVIKLKHNESILLKGLPNKATYTIAEKGEEGYVLRELAGSSGTIETGTTKEAKATNVHDTFGTLQIRKVLTGNDTDLGKEFKVKVTIYQPDGLTVDTSVDGNKYGDAAFHQGVSEEITIKSTGTKLITNLPNGAKYIVKETTPGDQYITKSIVYSPDENAIISGTTQQIATVTNERNSYGGLSVEKKVGGNAANHIANYEFTVTLGPDSNGNQINGTYGGMEFKNGVAKFTLQKDGTKSAYGLPNGITYSVTEKDYSADGYTTTYVYANGTIKGNTAYSTREAAVTAQYVADTNKAVVTNVRNADGTLSVTKVVEGNIADKTKAFTITIRLGGTEDLTGVTTTNMTLSGRVLTATLKDGETASASGIPNGTTFTVGETGADDYQILYQINGKTGTNGTIDEKAETKVKVTNTLNGYGGLKIIKQTAGNDPNKKTWFAFKVTLSEPLTGIFGQVRFEKGVSAGPADTEGDEDYTNGKVPAGYFKVKTTETISGQNGKEGYVVITGLPAGITYSVVEDDYSDTYDKAEFTNASGKIENVSTTPEGVTKDNITGANAVTCVNTRDRWGKLVIRKVVLGNNPDSDKKYRFEVEIKDKDGNGLNGTFAEVKFTNGEGVVNLAAGEEKVITDLPLLSTFAVTETDASVDGYVYTVGKKLEYREKPANGGDKVTIEKPDTNAGTIMVDQRIVTYTNTYQRITAQPKVTKHIEGADASTETFNFVLEAVSAKDSGDNPITPIPMPVSGGEKASANAASGKDDIAKFGEIVFTKAGLYIYRIREVIPNNKTEGMLYADKPIYAFVQVTEDSATKALSASLTYGDSTESAVPTVTNGTITNKQTKVPTFIKKIKDMNDSTGGKTDWHDSADYDIGDAIPYMLRAKLADNVTDYYKYHITFHDTMETGLTFKEITSVKVNGITTTNYTLTRSPNDGHSFDLTLSWGNGTDKITNTALNEAEVIVEFTATLNEKAVLGKPGNVNTAYLEYSCNPNLTDDGNGRMKPSEETNNTPKDSVIAFTYKIVISKVDEHHKPLAGAMFKLEKEIKGDDPQIISTVEANPNEVFTFNGLDDGNYILTEIKVPDGYKPIDPIRFTVSAAHNAIWDVNSENAVANTRNDVLTSLTGNTTNGELIFTPGTNLDSLSGNVKNKLTERTDVSLHKVWKDGENRDGKRPLTLTVRLLANGQVYSTETLIAANNWTLMKKGLPKVDAAGNDITYTWQETTPAGYTLESTTTDGILTTLTNVYTPEKTSASVRKVWDDREDIAELRPDFIEVQLFADGKAEGDLVTLSEANGWAYEWNDLDKNRGGKTITYTVEETEVPEGYTMSVRETSPNDFVITNKITFGRLVIEKRFRTETKPEDWDTQIEIPVNKIWDDFNNRDGNRPESITIRLYADGVQTATARITEADGWTYTFQELPKYNHNREIRYTISEDPVELYRAEIHEYTVINRYNPPLMSVSVRKVWDDNDNEIPIRPKSIRMTLNNGTSVLLNAANGWSATVSDLPAIVNGEPAQYVWIEQEVPGYRQTGKSVNGEVTTFTNKVVKLVKVPLDQPQPKVPGAIWFIFEEYDTALGGEILINHVGDCFD